jgi:hypothetical protein
MILIGVGLLAWQFYLVKQSYITKKVVAVETFSTEFQKHLNFIGNERKYEEINGTIGSTQKPDVLKTTHERYELMGKYEKETLSDVDPPFKKILLWNEVRELIILFSLLLLVI